MGSIACSLQKGDIVRLKRGFDRSFEALAVRRAGLLLKEGAIYEIVGTTNGTLASWSFSGRYVHFNIAGCGMLLS